MSENQKFYFLIENEFMCQSIKRKPQFAMTINLVEFSFDFKNENIKKQVWKIFYKISQFGYGKPGENAKSTQQNNIKELHEKSAEYVETKFIIKDPNKIFIGWVRDGHDCYNLCKENNRTDPIHDIFNILKNIYVGCICICIYIYKSKKEDITQKLNDLSI